MSALQFRLSLSLGLASAAIIALQLVIMQLLAASQWHHFAYMVISIALLGFGAAGAVLTLFREFLNRYYETALPILYLACGVTMAATGWLAGLFGDFDVFLLFFDRRQIGLLIFSYLAYCLPFFFGGLAITLVFYREVGRIGALYFANLAGSGVGAVLSIGLLWVLPATRLPGVLAFLPLFAAWATRPAHGQSPLLKTLWACALMMPVISLMHPSVPKPSEYKAIYGSLQLPHARIIHQSSSPYGLVEVVNADAQRFAPSLSLQYRHEPPVCDILFNNGEYYGALLGRNASSSAHILDYTPRALPYAVRQPTSVLVLEAATGNDVSHALSRGATQITVVESHRQVNRLLRDQHPEWIDSLYLDPAVTLHGNSARAYLGGRTAVAHDLIVLPALGAFGGTSGVHALQEQYSLTLEAFRAMWSLLTDQGMITVTVWQDQPPRATLKVISTWRRLLDEYGVQDRQRHVAAVRSWGAVTFLLSKPAFTRDEQDRIRRFAHALAFDPLILEDLQPDERERYNRINDRSFLENVDILMQGDPASLLSRYPFDIQPAEDDRPFFWRFMRWRSIPELRQIYGDREWPYLELGSMLAVVTFVQILLIAPLLIILPLFRIGWEGARRCWTFFYFAGLGIGFMFFEIVLIQKLVLYLGQPVYATAAVLATLLICSGAGSYYSSRLNATGRMLALLGALIASLILLYVLALTPLLTLSMGWSLIHKAMGVFLVLAPPAFCMGMMFPLGLRRLAGGHESHIPWACAIDSCLSVSATALATLMALESGFNAVMFAAVAAYATAALAGLRLGARA